MENGLLDDPLALTPPPCYSPRHPAAHSASTAARAGSGRAGRLGKDVRGGLGQWCFFRVTNLLESFRWIIGVLFFLFFF